MLILYKQKDHEIYNSLEGQKKQRSLLLKHVFNILELDRAQQKPVILNLQ